MIALVAYCACKKVGATKLVLIAVAVGSADGNSLGALGDAIRTGVGKTALTLALLTGVRYNLRIYQLVDLTLLYLDNGNEYELRGTDLLARAICHECDHLDGKLYTDVQIKAIEE